MALWFKGLWIGLAIAAPLGPVGILVLRRTLAHGRTAGLISGLGAASVDTVFAAIAGYGLTVATDLFVSQADWMRIAGGLFMVGLGLQTFLARPAGAAVRPAAASASGLVGMYLSAFLLTLTNPLTILAFAAIAAGGGVLDAQNPLHTAAWVAGLFCGSMLWWTILSQGAALLKPKLEQDEVTARTIQVWINRLAGAALVFFGAAALIEYLCS